MAPTLSSTSVAIRSSSIQRLTIEYDG